MALLGYAGGIGLTPETRHCMTVRECQVSAWISPSNLGVVEPMSHEWMQRSGLVALEKSTTPKSDGRSARLLT
jgi:hypothetical protein